MASICDGAVCLGLSTDLNGSQCLTNEVQCKDGKLTVPSQGTRQRRFSAGGTSDGAATATPVPGNGLEFEVTGPNIAGGGGPLLTVPNIVNPFCTEASIIMHCEFGWGYTIGDLDDRELFGVVELSGDPGVTMVDTAPPFTVATFPTAYSILLNGQVGAITSSKLLKKDDHDSYTVLAQAPAGAVFTVKLWGRVKMWAQGPGREIGLFTVAVSIIMSPTL